MHRVCILIYIFVILRVCILQIVSVVYKYISRCVENVTLFGISCRETKALEHLDVTRRKMHVHNHTTISINHFIHPYIKTLAKIPELLQAIFLYDPEYHCMRRQSSQSWYKTFVQPTDSFCPQRLNRAIKWAFIGNAIVRFHQGTMFHDVLANLHFHLLP